MRPQIVLFGSSIVQHSYYEGWGATLSHLYARKADILLRGYAAWNSKRALQILDDLFPKNNTREQPALAIVYFGGNDANPEHSSGLGPHVPLEDYKQNMKNIIIHLQEHSPMTRLLFLSTPPLNEAMIEAKIEENGDKLGPINEVRREYSEELLNLCKEMKIKAIDVFSAIQSVDNWEDECFLNDGIHFSPKGNKVVTDEILKVLREAEWVPSLHWRSLAPEYGEDSPYDPVHPDGTTTINVSDIPFPLDVEWGRLKLQFD